MDGARLCSKNRLPALSSAKRGVDAVAVCGADCLMAVILSVSRLPLIVEGNPRTTRSQPAGPWKTCEPTHNIPRMGFENKVASRPS